MNINKKLMRIKDVNLNKYQTILNLCSVEPTIGDGIENEVDYVLSSSELADLMLHYNVSYIKMLVGSNAWLYRNPLTDLYVIAIEEEFVPTTYSHSNDTYYDETFLFYTDKELKPHVQIKIPHVETNLGTIYSNITISRLDQDINFPHAGNIFMPVEDFRAVVEMFQKALLWIEGEKKYNERL